MSENTKLWDNLGRTDPKHVKKFKRAGGFEGTAIKPMWSYRRMTEEFGPCGEGWGVGEPSFQVVPAGDGEVLVYCTASAWYTLDGEKRTVYGVGGDKVAGKNKYGLNTDDEAFKKAFTDAVTNALKMIGVGADVHMGMFDDNKYVNTMAQEFADPPPKSSASLKRADENGKDAWDRLMSDLQNDFVDCHSLVGVQLLRASYRERARIERWPRAWMEALANEFDAQEEALKQSEMMMAG